MAYYIHFGPLPEMVVPMLTCAGVAMEMLYSTHPGNAREAARDRDLHAHQGIVVVGGDGLVHEVCGAHHGNVCQQPLATLKCFR